MFILYQSTNGRYQGFIVKNIEIIDFFSPSLSIYEQFLKSNIMIYTVFHDVA